MHCVHKKVPGYDDWKEKTSIDHYIRDRSKFMGWGGGGGYGDLEGAINFHPKP